MPFQRVLLGVLLALSLVLVAAYSREDESGLLHELQAGVQNVVAPLKFVGASAGSVAEDAGEALADITASQETLSGLKEQNAALIEMIAQTEEYRQEIERLQSLLNLRDAYSIEGASARV
ncbi:MAG: rod shape-determining protein MreC, partial [Eggerthellaceae bacterium]|nr:rod shape-determining protein MreC [Eggerthellaceae bacterium]